MTSEFQGEPKRDASASIGGFVYQLDWSVLRWLQLESGEAIELEGGEDIDVVGPILLDPEASPERVLIALKHVAGTITLNTRDAVAAVAHLAGHRRRNPGHSISMQFITTAAITREKNSPFTGRVRALDVWNAAHAAGALTDSQAIGIRTLLKNAKRPRRAGVTDEDWDALQAALQDRARLESLVSGLEWRVSAPQGQRIVHEALELLSEALPTPEDAPRAHRFLFHFMLRGLLQGQKRYDEQALENAVAAFRREEGVDAAVAVRDRLLRIETELGAVTERVVSIEAVLAAIVGTPGLGATPLDLEEMARANADTLLARLASRLETKLPRPARPDLSPPPKSGKAVDRGDASSVIASMLAGHAWVHVHGSIRTGKTSLVRQVVDSHESCAWVRCRGLTEGQILSRLREAWGDTGRDAADVIASLVAQQGLLVLDDLPDPENSLELMDALQAALESSSNGLLITVGARRISGLADESQLRAPAFSEAEVRDLLSQHEAPLDVLENAKLLERIRVVTQGHPERLRHAVEVLKRADWQAMTALSDLFTPHADEAEVTRVLRLVDSTVPDVERRALLYRLCIYAGGFDAVDAARLADVPQPITEARTHVAVLEGLWLEVDTPSTWTVSPAVRPFGVHQLPVETRRAAHLEAATRYLERGKLTMVDAIRTAEHFEAAEEPDRAAGVAAHAMISMVNDDRLDHDPGFVILWPQLPAGMSPGKRLWVRAAQLRAAHASGLPITLWVDWLDTEQASAGAEPTRLFASLMVHGAIVESDPGRAARWILDATSAVNVPEADSPVAELLEHIVFVHAWHLEHEDHLVPWLDLLSLLPPETRTRVAQREGFALTTRQALAEMWWTRAGADRKTWARLLETLDQVRGRAIELGLPVLAAAAIRARVIVMCEEFDALDDAVDMAVGCVDDFAQADRALLLDEAGRQLVYKRQDARGLPHLRQALELYPSGPDYDTERYNAFLIACEAAGRLGELDDAVAFAAGAVDVATQADSMIMVAQSAVAHAEHAVALWRSGRRRETLAALERALLALLHAEERDDVWKSRFLLLGHATGFYASMAATGKPPGGLRDGSPYWEPEPGMFRNGRSDLADRYDPSVAAALPAQVLFYAVAARDWVRATAWAWRTVQLAEATAAIDPSTLAHNLLAIKALRDGDIEAALNHFMSAARAMAWTAGLVERAPPTPDTAMAVLESIPARTRRNFVGVVAENVAYAVAAVIARVEPEQRHHMASSTATWLEELHAMAGHPCIVDAVAVMRSMIPGAKPEQILAVASRDPSQEDPGPWGLAQLVLGAIHDTDPSSALARHIHASRVAEMKRQGLGVIFDLALTPFFVGHWREFTSTAGFRLRQPESVRTALAKIEEANDGNEIRATLLVMAEGLELRMDSQLRSWLAEARTSHLDD